ncbi:MAG: type I restriction endonuclease subunit R [Planctomycetes bacterium]|nr:type I restriction endonuclease subunit R [Planctomycetota bacterium]
MAGIDEALLEDELLGWLRGEGYEVLHGPTIAPGEPSTERDRFDSAVLPGRLRAALSRLNPELPDAAIAEAVRVLTTPTSPALLLNNRAFHKHIVDGVSVPVRRKDGSHGHTIARVIDWDHPEENEFVAVNQLAVREGQVSRRADVVVYANGLALAVVELKTPSKETATVKDAWNQLQTYQREVHGLFHHNALLVISDGIEARVGTLTSEFSRFMPWKTIDGADLAPPTLLPLEVVARGVFERARFLDLVRRFVVFEDDGHKIEKKVAGYHQFHAVRKAIDCTLRATAAKGDRRIGVVWHTQGSGKSLTMAFYAGAIVQHPRMENPTLVVLTDRNDLDKQLFDNFCFCSELLRQSPKKAESRAELRQFLDRASGGVIFTTIQKFFPEGKGDQHPLLSDRRNIVVIADEAHRSQYDFIDGFARHLRDALPNASFIGFTGTPIETTDKNTRAVFGEYIDTYDIERAVQDGNTVRIYYESRLAKLVLKPDQKPRLDTDFEEVTEGEEVSTKERLKSKWAKLEAVVGAEPRVRQIAQDLVDHYERRQEAQDGKALVVAMSRRICVDLYNAIVEFRPKWHDADDTKGAIKVVMTGSASDPATMQPHVRSKTARDALAKRFKDPRDPLKIVIVRDMWLTGFDVPCLHTMYVDKPMQGHGLMQAIARVNRVFRDKPGGLVVDYLGLAPQLKEALATYTGSGGKGKPTIDQAEAVAIMQEKHEVVLGFFHGYDLDAVRRATSAHRLTKHLPTALNHVLQPDAAPRPGEPTRKERFLVAVLQLSQAFALAVPAPEALAIRDDVGFFQTVRAAILKLGKGGPGKTEEDYDHAIRQIVSGAVAAGGVVDIYAAAGLKSPDISILSEEFLQEVRGLPQRNLAVELLNRLLQDEVKSRSRTNLVQARSFADLLEKAIAAYQNRAVEAAKVIEELIALARQMREAAKRGDALGLTKDEVAFYDALEVNDSAVKVLGEPTLKQIAHELVSAVRNSVTIDWTSKESVRAKIRILVKRILRQHGYPPDKTAAATETVLAQAELLCADWAA